jgi:hypothetical protein
MNRKLGRFDSATQIVSLARCSLHPNIKYAEVILSPNHKFLRPIK